MGRSSFRGESGDEFPARVLCLLPIRCSSSSWLPTAELRVCGPRLRGPLPGPQVHLSLHQIIGDLERLLQRLSCAVASPSRSSVLLFSMRLLFQKGSFPL